ncbi:hypothetical protein DWV16_06180 [Anaerotruncus sp. AF02-27]|uniref:hypothetical protein n=1 Tax=Anaerotruncus TaxID=244127 RepID=UPI000E48B27D|nr:MULTISPECIES: hypothetical protein [Anaerotruncus]RGX55934.1 hypothetical protein DWV16_06180 [Anaerotruncus sp. AF02-27]
MKLDKRILRASGGTLAVVLAASIAVTASDLGAVSPAVPAAPETVPAAELAGSAPNAGEDFSASAAPAYKGKKTETVFVNLKADGTPYDTIVSDWLHSDETGAQLTDRTNLKNVRNIKGDETPTQDGENLVWKLGGNDLYYQGTTDKKLPLKVDIAYKLDGKKMSPEKIAGKSGKLEMTIRFENTTSHKVTVAGKSSTMSTPLMVIAGMSLSNDHFDNIELSDGNLVSDGNSQAVAFVSMPGLAKSLNIGGYSLSEINDLDFPEEFTLTADVTEFEMGPIGIAATTELPDLDDLKKSQELDDMEQDLYDLQDMQNDLERVDPVRDLRSLITNPERTVGAQVLVDDIFAFYDLNKDILDILPKYVTEENIKIYDRINHDLRENSLDTLLDDETVDEIIDLADDLSTARLQELLDDYDTLKKLDRRKVDRLITEGVALLNAMDGEGAQKGAASLQKLLNCSDPLMALLPDIEKLNDEAFQKLIVSVLKGQLPGTGKITNQELLYALSTILPDSDKVLLGMDMAYGYIAPTTLELLEEEERPVKNPVSPGGGKHSEEQPDKTPSDESDKESESTEPVDSENGSSENGGESDGSADPEVSGAEEGGSDAQENSSGDPGSDVTSGDSASDSADSSEPAVITVSTQNGVVRSRVLAGYIENTEFSATEDEGPSESDPTTEDISDPAGGSEKPIPGESDGASQAEEPVLDDEKNSTPDESAAEKNDDREPEAGTKKSLRSARALGAGQTPRERIIEVLEGLSPEEFDALCKVLEQSSDPQMQLLMGLRTDLGALKKAMQTEGLTEDELQAAMAFSREMLPQVNALRELTKDAFAPLLKNVPEAEQEEYIVDLINTLRRHIAENEDNMITLTLLLEKLDDEDLLDLVEDYDDLREDLRDARPILKALRRDLNQKDMNKSLHASPETTETLLKMKNDLEEYRNVSESLRWAMQDQNVEISRKIIANLDNLQAKDAVGNAIGKMDDVDELFERKELFVQLSEQYRIFTDAPDDLETEVKFVMKTDEIKAPEPVVETVAAEPEKKGFITWCKSLIGK